MKRLALACLFVLALVASIAPAPAAEADCTTNFKWNQSWAMLRGAENLPSSWDSSIKAAAAQWSGVPGADWRVSWLGIGFIGPIIGGDISKSTPAGGFGGAPAVTVLVASGGNLSSSNIFLNPAYTWNTSGTMNQASQKADVRTVVVHELGHWVVLNHPNQCGAMTSAETASAMNPNWKKKWTINSDDKAGLAKIK
ncbi:MAG: matrixin family metalloprotease [Propionibacteriales bacterium]|nr:matrixin family metalloprotease [Propionibacteriales bacterium]